MKTNKWQDFFAVRRIGQSTYYVTRRGSRGAPISGDFTTSGQARTWIRKNWETIIMEEILFE